MSRRPDSGHVQASPQRRAGTMQRLQHRAVSGTGALALLMAAMAALACSCGQEVIVYDALYLAITADKTDTPLTRLDFAVARLDDNDPTQLVFPTAAAGGQFQVPLPAGANLTAKPFRVQVNPNPQWAKRVSMRVLGRDAAGHIKATWFGEIDATAKQEQALRLTVVGSAANCDQDGDGVPACKAECKTVAPLCDCDDDPSPDAGQGGLPKGARSSPFGIEDACLDAGNGIDEDCRGGDIAATDSDQDGDPDCFEQKQCPVVDGLPAEKNPAVHRKASELCDGIDNNCDGKIDDGLAYIDIDGTVKSAAKGDKCGTGACEKDATGKTGEVVCSADKKTLVCSTASQKGSEQCANKIDDNCNGQIDEGCEANDVDGDGVANDDEIGTASKAGPCKFTYAHFHSEYHPGAAEPCCPAGKDCSGATGLYDFNCDGKVTACPADDPDGDGKSGALDCAPNDPDVYVGAKQACGDGKGPCPADGDVACDKDGDGDKYNDDVDCAPQDAAVHPFAAEVCNAKDDDCDGLVDEGNPGGEDAKCGDPDGDCGTVAGVEVCKHFVAKEKDFKPGDLDCLKAPYALVGDGPIGWCIGCFGDKRPAKETCDDHDQDCDGATDEDFPYTEAGAAKPLVWGQPCDGVGTCGKGVVQCADPAKAICSTDPGGKQDQAKLETCNNQDDNCNGKTDENLTSVSDSKCEKTGVCGGASTASIQTVCDKGIWRCDYSKVSKIEFSSSEACSPGSPSCQCTGLDPTKPPACYAMVEKSCDGEDNDCDGQTDEDFDFSDWNKKSLKITQGCGTGACAGGKVVCQGGANGMGLLTCDTLPKAIDELCNVIDDDCDGQTDEMQELPVTKSSCLLKGVCTPANVVATCPAGKWLCNYGGVAGFEEGNEVSCDGLDNDCDGQTDEDFAFKDFDGGIRTVGQVCGTGVCAAGKVVCTADKKALTCDTLPKIKSDVCDKLDNDCDGKTDEDYLYTQENGAKLATNAMCDGIGACGIGKVECAPGKTDVATCSTDPNGSTAGNSIEKCNDLDDNCNGQVDEGCNLDKDGYCTAAMTTVGTPKSCPMGGGDCVDDPGKDALAAQINPGAGELCDGIDNNCKSGIDEIFQYIEPTSIGLGVGSPCGLGECSKAATKVVCGADKLSAVCPGYKPALEVCDNKDNDCDGKTDEGCDDDGDKFCDFGMQVFGAVTVCPLTVVAKDGEAGNDCNDTNPAIHPAAVEACDDIDNNCALGTDEACDKDGDGYCDAGRVLGSKTPAVCSKTVAGKGKGDDCNDSVKDVNPGGVEVCDDIDNNCSGILDEGCDDDGDQFCDAAIAVVGKPKVCAKTTAVAGKGDDCDDTVTVINPAAVEACDNTDNNCAGGSDEGCDNDGDLYCDAAMKVTGTPAVCPKTKAVAGNGDDCNDVLVAINPGSVETCDGIDNNCAAATDEGCDDDKDGYCDAAMTVVGAPAVCPKTLSGKSDDCNDDPLKGGAMANPSQTELCNGVDDNCDGKVDEGCDDDGDKYCDSAMKVYAAVKLCTFPVGAKDGDLGNDCQDDPAKGGNGINPGAAEKCTTVGIDDNCNGKVDEESAQSCVAYFVDGDADGYGSGSSKCLCKAGDVAGFVVTVGGDCTDSGSVSGVLAKDINPGKTELCNNADDNCSGAADEGCDDDKDGYCDAAMTLGASVPTVCPNTKTPGGKGDDCNDGSNAVNPGKTEVCNGIDDTCSSGTDEGCDDDGDQYCDATMGVASPVPAICSKTVVVGGKGDDCNDTSNAVNPGKSESCNGIDDNCSGGTDEGCDNDGDQYCDASMTVSNPVPAICSKTVVVGGKGDDCNDTSNAVNPGKTEVCNGIDDNCGGGTDENLASTVADCSGVSWGKGVCQASEAGKVGTCAGGKWTCNYAAIPLYNAASPETACGDSADNNCDGLVDNGCP